MKVHLTEQSAEILLNEEEVQALVKGESVVGSPETAFLSPFGQRIVIVRQAELKGGKKAIPGHSEEAGLEICKQLGIDPSRVLSIDIFVLHGTLVVKTLDGDVNCHLIPERNKDNELVFRIVKD